MDSSIVASIIDSFGNIGGAVIGVTGGAVIGWFAKRSQKERTSEIVLPKITIESFRDGDEVSNPHKEVEGRIEGEIPSGYELVIAHTRVDQGYWFHGTATTIGGKKITKNTKQWKASQLLNQNTTIEAILINSDVKILYDYYHLCCKEVFCKEGHFPSIENLPTDGVIYCHKVAINFNPSEN